MNNKPSNSNIVTGKNCVSCCENGRSTALFAVFKVLGQVIAALGEEINYIDRKRNLVGFSEEAIIAYGFLDENDAASLQVQFMPPNVYDKLAPSVNGFLVGATTGILAIERIRQWQTTMELISNLQTALQSIEVKTPLCEACCKKKLFSQESARIIVTDKHRKRVQ